MAGLPDAAVIDVTAADQSGVKAGCRPRGNHVKMPGQRAACSGLECAIPARATCSRNPPAGQVRDCAGTSACGRVRRCRASSTPAHARKRPALDASRQLSTPDQILAPDQLLPRKLPRDRPHRTGDGAHVRSGQAPACPLPSDRSARRDSGVKCDCAPRHLGALVLITTGDRRIYASGCTAQVKALIDLWVSRVLVVSAVVQRLGRDSLTFRT